MTKLLTMLLLITFATSNVLASHIKGGYLTHRNISNLTVEVTFTGYRNAAGVLFGQGLLDMGDGTIFGDEDDEIVQWSEPVLIANGIEELSFTFSHTYASTGYYTVSYAEAFRSEAINLNESIQSDFYVESLIAVDPFFSNQSPINLYPPDFTAVSGKKFVTSLAMADSDGDSLSYHLIIPKTASGTDAIYQWPNDPNFYSGVIGNEAKDGPPSLKVDRFTGNIIWDAPFAFGTYSFAVRIEEWRKVEGQLISVGYTTFDYLVEVLVNFNPSVIELPITTCFDSGSDIEQTIKISNPRSAGLYINFYSEIDGLLIDGISVSNWNEQFGDATFSEEEFSIRVQLPASSTLNSSGFQQSTIRMESDVSQFDFASTQNFTIGIGCTIPEVVLSTVNELKASMSFNGDNMRLVVPESGPVELTIFDLRGVQLFQVNQQLSKGVHDLSLTMLPESIYNVVFLHKNGILTQKLLLTK